MNDHFWRLDYSQKRHITEKVLERRILYLEEKIQEREALTQPYSYLVEEVSCLKWILGEYKQLKDSESYANVS